MTGILARSQLKRSPGGRVLYDLRSSWATAEEIRAAGGVAEMCRVGHSFVKAAMREKDAVFAGEEIDARTIAVITASGLMARRLSSIAVITASGLMARRLSSLRPEQRIIALTTERGVACELSLVWGIETIHHEPCDSTEEMMKLCERTLVEAGIVQQKEIIVLMAGRLSGLGLSSSVTLYTIGGPLPRQV